MMDGKDISDGKVKWLPGMSPDDYYVDFTTLEIMTQIWVFQNDRKGLYRCSKCDKVLYKPTKPYRLALKFCPKCQTELMSIDKALEKMAKTEEILKKERSEAPRI